MYEPIDIRQTTLATPYFRDTLPQKTQRITQTGSFYIQMILGISAGFHDAAVAVIDASGAIQFAAHSERYSKIKNDAGLSPDLLTEIQNFAITEIAYYERPWAHNLQQLSLIHI